MNEDDDTFTCRCGAAMLEWQQMDHELDACPLECCDDASCRALKAPVTLDEYKTAYEHWRKHRFMSGCSHGN